MADRINGDIVELLVALTVVVVFLVPALGYEGPLGQFPQLFLFGALVFLGLELVIKFLPAPYGPLLERFTSGLTEEMTEEMTREVSEMQESTADAEGTTEVEEVETPGAFESGGARFVAFLGVLAVFYVVAYLLGFLLAIPVFVFGVIYLFGSWNPLVWLGLSVGLMAGTYLLFGQLMNVPITEGLLL